MKINYENDLLIIYLYKNRLTFDNLNVLTKEIKSILINLVKYYGVSLSGIYEVLIYENSIYGCVLEIIKNKELDYGDFIDLKLSIHSDVPFYLKFNNYNYCDDCERVYYDDSSFYVSVEDVNNILNKIELGDIVYKNVNVNNFVKIVK